MNNLILNETEKGRIFLCSFCNGIHVEFGNISLKFEVEEFKSFKELLEAIDINNPFKGSMCINDKGKIMFATGLPEVVLLFDPYEIEELKKLVSRKEILSAISKTFMERHRNSQLSYWNSMKRKIKRN